MENLTDRLKRLQGGRILDIATGSGQFVQVLSESLASFEQVIGIDVSESAVRQAAERFSGERFAFRVMDCRRMTFPDQSFDTVSISNSLHHLNEPVDVLGEMKRVCRSGGHVLVSEMVNDDQSAAQMTHVLLHHWWAAIDSRNGVVHRPTFSRAQIRAMLETTVFQEIEYFEWEEDDGDPRDPERLLQFHGIIDDYLAKIPSGDDAAQLTGAGRQLRERLEAVGILGATTLVAIARP